MALLPSTPPVHSNMSELGILGYIADSAQQIVTGTAPALPSAAPVHANISEADLLGYIADSAQDAAA